MSKRKEPEGAAPAADAPSGDHSSYMPGAAPAAPPRRLGDHSSYMPEPMLLLADVRIKVQGGTVLPAHSTTLVQHCVALARSSELFLGASPARPAALSSPFDEYAEADVARFLRCIYTAAAAPAKEDAMQAAVVRLAHALDAAPVLAVARRHLLRRSSRCAAPSHFNDVDQIAALCGWDDVCTGNTAGLADMLQMPLGDATTPAQLAVSHAVGFSMALAVSQDCSQEFIARVVGTLTADYRQLRAAASVQARSSLDPAARATAIARRPGTAIEVDGRFVCVVAVPASSDAQPSKKVTFESHDLEWRLSLSPNGAAGAEGFPAVTLELARGWPKKVRFQVGFINLRDAPPRQGAVREVLIVDDRGFGNSFADLTGFRDPAAGWVARGVAAPFARVLEVRDLTPAELAAAEAGAAEAAAAEGL